MTADTPAGDPTCISCPADGTVSWITVEFAGFNSCSVVGGSPWRAAGGPRRSAASGSSRAGPRTRPPLSRSSVALSIGEVMHDETALSDSPGLRRAAWLAVGLLAPVALL